MGGCEHLCVHTYMRMCVYSMVHTAENLSLNTAFYWLSAASHQPSMVQLNLSEMYVCMDVCMDVLIFVCTVCTYVRTYVCWYKHTVD